MEIVCLCFTSCIQALARRLCLLSTYSVPDMKVLLMVLLGHKDGFVFTQPKRQGKRGVICSFLSSWGKNFNAILILTDVELWDAPHRLLCPQHFVPSCGTVLKAVGSLEGGAWMGRWPKVVVQPWRKVVGVYLTYPWTELLPHQTVSP